MKSMMRYLVMFFGIIMMLGAGEASGITVINEPNRVYARSHCAIYCFNASDGKLVWEYNVRLQDLQDVDCPITGYYQPIVLGGRVYVDFTDEGKHRYLYCFGARTGKLIWRHTTDDPTYYWFFTVVGDHVYLGGSCLVEDEDIYCLDAGSGKLIWKYKSEVMCGWGNSNHNLPTKPTVVGGRLYVSSQCGGYCLDAKNGKMVWDLSTDTDCSSADCVKIGYAPLVVDGRIYCDCCGDICCLDASDGRLIWRYESDYDVGFGPPTTVVANRVYFDYGCLSARTGELIWKRGLSSFTVVGDRVYVATNVDTNNKVCCLDASDGKLIWEYDCDGSTGSLVVSGGHVYISIAGIRPWQYDVCCLDAEDGKLIWGYDSGSFRRSWVTPAGEHVYAHSENGFVYCLDARDGKLIWGYDVGYYISRPTVAYIPTRRCGITELDFTGGSEVAPPITKTPPDSWDWRDEGMVTPIRHQGNCGSCWAFGSLAAMESVTMIEQNIEVNLSEQFLVSCTPGSCEGWTQKATLNYLESNGVVDEDCFPYVAKDVSSSGRCSDWKSKTREISDWGWVDNDIDAIKSAIYDYGPLVAGMKVYEDFFDFEGGIYEHVWGDSENYHMVCIVGYNTAERYWIVKNSWGTDWGESGFFRIAWNDDSNMDDMVTWIMVPE